MNPDLRMVMDRLAEILVLAANGDWVTVGKRAAELALEALPVEDLKSHLDDAAARRAKALADAAERAKFGA